MSRDPFALTGPTCLSFSGGSTSGYMLRRTIDANPVETLREWLRVSFANTGLEHEKTLKFVDDCDRAWLQPLGLGLEWVEYRDDDAGHAVVTYETASRDGEPFRAIIEKRNYLPNPITRFCTSELKIRAMHKRLKAVGWHEIYEGWDQFIGIRADEPRRVSKIRARGRSTESARESMCMPLADAGIGYRDVDAFWSAQPFHLELPRYNGRTLAGNCMLCFLKPRAQVQSLIAEEPARAVWWIKAETDTVRTIKPRFVETGFYDEDGEPLLKQAAATGATFRSDRPSYAAMTSAVEAQGDAFGHLPPPAPSLGESLRALDGAAKKLRIDGPSGLPLVGFGVDDDDTGGIDCFCGD